MFFFSPLTCANWRDDTFYLVTLKIMPTFELRRLNMDVRVPLHSFSPPWVASLVNDLPLDTLKM